MTQEASSANPNPKPPYILALDIGTSSTRALLFDATGNTLPNVLAQRPNQLRITNEGEVSVDPDAVVSVVSQTIYDSLEMAVLTLKMVDNSINLSKHASGWFFVIGPSGQAYAGYFRYPFQK